MYVNVKVFILCIRISILFGVGNFWCSHSLISNHKTFVLKHGRFCAYVHGNASYWIVIANYTELTISVLDLKKFKDEIFKVKQKPWNPWKLYLSKFSGYTIFLSEKTSDCNTFTVSKNLWKPIKLCSSNALSYMIFGIITGLEIRLGHQGHLVYMG